MKLIDSFQEISADWMAGVLAVEPGTVSACTIRRTIDTPGARSAVVGIEYARKEAALPSSVFVKISKHGLTKMFPQFGKREVEFYRAMTNRGGIDCVPVCHFAAFDEEANAFNVVLDDLSDTHFQTEYPLPPFMPYCRMAAESLARVHAYWWDHPEPLPPAHSFETAERVAAWHSKLEGMCSAFISFMGDGLDEGQKRIVEGIPRAVDASYQRYCTSKNITLIHGDAHLWNFLFPNESESITMIIDWQPCGEGLAAEDLAYMMASWSPRRRREHQTDMLETYHGALVRNGVRDYALSDLVWDYRRAVGFTVIRPLLWWWTKTVPPTTWYNHLQNLCTEYERLRCDEVLGTCGETLG